MAAEISQRSPDIKTSGNLLTPPQSGRILNVRNRSGNPPKRQNQFETYQCAESIRQLQEAY
jgi:hypothetical protein